MGAFAMRGTTANSGARTVTGLQGQLTYLDFVETVADRGIHRVQRGYVRLDADGV